MPAKAPARAAERRHGPGAHPAFRLERQGVLDGEDVDVGGVGSHEIAAQERLRIGGVAHQVARGVVNEEVGVADIDAALAELKEKGVRLIDETPRKGAGGAKIAFLHPKATGGVLVELCQR